MKKLLSLILSIFLLLSCILSVPSIASESSYNYTAETYVSYLKSQNATEELKQFNELSDIEKNKFLTYINNPLLLIEVFKTNYENSNLKTFYNGDITIESSQSQIGKPYLQTHSTQNIRATYTETVRILGIKVWQVASWVQYYHNGSRILDIAGSNHSIRMSLIPLLDYSFSGKIDRKTTTEAISSSDWSISFVHDNLGLIIASGEIGVAGSINNTARGWSKVY